MIEPPPPEYYQRHYVDKASPNVLAIMDVRLLAAQYDQHTRAGSAGLSAAQGWSWLAEVRQTIMMVLAEHGDCYSLSTQAAMRALIDVDPLEQSPVYRKTWARRARRVLGALLEELGPFRTLPTSLLMLNATAWNVQMAAGLRPVTFKVIDAKRAPPCAPADAGAIPAPSALERPFPY